MAWYLMILAHPVMLSLMSLKVISFAFFLLSLLCGEALLSKPSAAAPSLFC
jgi:hypothetical protein